MEHVTSDVTAVLPQAHVRVGGPHTPELVVFFGETGPIAIPVEQPITIGRDAGCELTLDADAGVSRQHCLLERGVDGEVVVRDLGSRNGTFVDGRRIREVRLNAPATLRVGDHLLRLQWPDERWAAPTLGPLTGGRSLAALRRKLTLLAPSDLPLLILGETGTGKDVLARQLHDGSGRTGPFLPVNCASLPEALAESELFGHTSAAFTGASRAHPGLFSAANGGTLFLDEVGELPPGIQAKLLRVLEDGAVRPVGATRSHPVDVRILSATNRDLGLEVEQGRFRRDLLARLSGLELKLPPLRDRVEDVPALAEHLLARRGFEGRRVRPDAVEALCLYPWSMNVRELDQVLRGAALETPGDIRFQDLPPRVRAPYEAGRTHGAPKVMAVDQRSRIEAALREHGGNIRQASRTLGLSRTHVYRLLSRWGVDPKSFRAS